MDEEPDEDRNDQIDEKKIEDINTAIEEIQKKHQISDITGEVSLLLRNISNFFTKLENEPNSENRVISTEPDEEILHIASANEIEDHIILDSEFKKKTTKILPLDKIYDLLSNHNNQSLDSKFILTSVGQPTDENQNSCRAFVEEVKPEQDFVTASMNLKNDLAALSMIDIPSENFEQIKTHVDDIVRLRKVNQEMSSLIQKIGRFLDKKKILQRTETQELTTVTNTDIEASEPTVTDEQAMQKSVLIEEIEDGDENLQIPNEATAEDDESCQEKDGAEKEQEK